MSAALFKQLAAAVLVVGGVVGSLHWLGEKKAGEAAQLPDAATQLPTPQLFSLIPERAWLVVDFSGALAPALPFAGEPVPCGEVPAPERAIFAAVPEQRGSSELFFLLATRSASDAFYDCAKQKILAVGGREAPKLGEVSVLESPSGVLLRAPDGALVFSTRRADLEELTRFFSPPGPSAAVAGPHRTALAHNDPTGSLLYASLELPDGWLSGLGEEGQESPLRALSGASFRLNPDGSAQGSLRCEPAGCAALGLFVERAIGDLLGSLPALLRARFASSVQVIPPSTERPDHVGLTVSSQGVELVRALGGSWLELGPR